MYGLRMVKIKITIFRLKADEPSRLSTHDNATQTNVGHRKVNLFRQFSCMNAVFL